jgi:hypothetical protein
LEYGVYFSQLIRSILSFEFSPFTTLPYSKFQRKSEVRIKTKKHEKTDKFECQGMTQRKLFLLFPLFKFVMVYWRLPDNWRTKDYKRTQHKHTTQTIGSFIVHVSTKCVEFHLFLFVYRVYLSFVLVQKKIAYICIWIGRYIYRLNLDKTRYQTKGKFANNNCILWIFTQ